MATVVAGQREEWIGVRAAAERIGTSTYSIQKYALCGLIRARQTALLKIVYHRDDVERIAELGVQLSQPVPTSWGVGPHRGPGGEINFNREKSPMANEQELELLVARQAAELEQIRETSKRNTIDGALHKR